MGVFGSTRRGRPRDRGNLTVNPNVTVERARKRVSATAIMDGIRERNAERFGLGLAGDPDEADARRRLRNARKRERQGRK